MTGVPTELVERYLDFARSGDHRSATAVALDLLNDGVPVDAVLDGLLGAAQREAGARWHRNEWTVADEHLVTTTTTAVAEAVAAMSPAPAAGGDLVVVCAEGDWHALPARLFTEGMRERGWAVTFLGASTPADHVAEFLGRRPVDALAISCALPLHYLGAARLVEAAHSRGVPAIVGGAGIDGRGERALALGADGAATSAAGADAVIRRVMAGPVRTEPVRLDPSALRLDAEAADHAEAALADLRDVFPPLADYDRRQVTRTLEDLGFIVRFAAAAVLVSDATVWTDFAAWQVSLLGARGVPEQAFLAGVDVLAGRVGTVSPEAAALLEAPLWQPGHG